MSKKIGDRVREAREARGWSQEQLGRAIGYSDVAVGHWERGKNQVSVDNLIKISQALNYPLVWLLTGETPSRTDTLRELLTRPVADLLEVTTIPLVGQIRAGLPVLAQENIEGEVTVPTGLGASFALRVRGDSMVAAGIREGDVAICRGVADVPAESGDIVVPLINGDEATLKYLVEEGGVWKLRAANPKYADIELPEDHVMQGVVVLVQKEPPPLEALGEVKAGEAGPWASVNEAAARAGLTPEALALVIQAMGKAKGG